uniref:Uncharacterized protein n=1 Tax=Halteria grandinella TaxID=5974 RepID=A0A7T0M4X9_HALGN|nr:hypothetical protein J6764_mgp28 [Halteria grandinella]QPL15987.1 hypothetical protein [Halteria grandinella]
MNNSKFTTKFKNHFKNLNFYSMPASILFIVRKRLNLAFSYIFFFLILFYSFF